MKHIRPLVLVCFTLCLQLAVAATWPSAFPTRLVTRRIPKGLLTNRAGSIFFPGALWSISFRFVSPAASLPTKRELTAVLPG